MAAESADILGDRHIVVVEHHEQRLPEVPALLSASYAMPPVSAPSPMTATTWYLLVF